MDERKADDITISLLRDAKLESMLRYFADVRTEVRNVQPGIHYLSGYKILFPTGQEFCYYATMGKKKSDIHIMIT